ncbi:MAG: hypothetical protein DRO88_12900 [Promethearchaeia archaeon]|nr:MAG: hypothetical protein DRO88_12900 [Candidatus Lokiarchaeia archaeon]
MVHYDLQNFGTVEINRKKIRCDLNISAAKFFQELSEFEGMLSKRGKQTIETAIKSKREEKTKEQDELEAFFARCEKYIRQRLSSMEINQQTGSGKSDTQGKEGGSNPDEVEGERILVKVEEKLVAKYRYNFLADQKDSIAESEEENSVEDSDDENGEESEEDLEEFPEGYGILTREGQVVIQNIAEDQRIWDISGRFKHNGTIEKVEEEFFIKELNRSGEENSEYTEKYTIKADKEPSLKLKEDISTINDPNTITYSLNMDQDNVVFFKLDLINTEEYPIQNIELKKKLFESSSDVNVKSVSVGEHSLEDNYLIWKIEELEPNGQASLEFTLTVHIADKDEKVRSGTVEIKYSAVNSLTALEIENFEATGENMVSTSEEQEEEKPDIFKGFLEYENLSPYIAKLKKVSVKESEKEDAPELVNLDEGTEVFLGARGVWRSNEWEIDTQGKIPNYEKTVQFILLHNLEAITSTTVQVDDVELAVAIFDANVVYDLETIESFREISFNATHTLTNGGATPFDYLSIEQTVPEHFKLPEKEELKLTKDGKEYEIPADWIHVEDRKLNIKMDGLKDSEMGMFEPNQEIQIIFPIVAQSLSPEDEFISPITWKANTLPRGEPIIIKEEGEATKIEVVHRRLKVFRGKSIQATDSEGVYKIHLKVRNRSEFPVENYELRDRVPAKFEMQDPNIEPTETEKMDGRKVLIWNIDEIPAGGEVEITYTIHAKKDSAEAAEAQFSM